MPPSLSELKVTPSFCFPCKIPDDRAVTITYLIISFRSPWFKYPSLFSVVKNFFAIVLSISEFSSCCFNEVTLFLDDLVSLLFCWAFVFGYYNCRNYSFFYGFGYFNNFWFKKSFCYFMSQLSFFRETMLENFARVTSDFEQHQQCNAELSLAGVRGVL